MRNKFTYAISIVLAYGLLAIHSTTQAQSPTWFGNSADGNWLVGGKISTLQNGLASYTDAQAIALVLGYNFGRAIGENGTASLEFEFMTTYDEGGIRNSSAEWETNNINLFLAYRSPGDIYFKGKLGLYSSDIEVKNFGTLSGSSSDTSFGYGVGLGFRLRNNINIELEFTGNGSSDVNDLSGISIGGHINF